MHFIRLKSMLLILFLFVSSLFFIDTSVADEENSDYYVNARFDMKMITATEFEIKIYMDVIQAVAFGVTYSNSQVKGLTTSINDDDKEALGVIKNYLHNSLESQIQDTFEKSHIYVLQNKPIFESDQFTEEYRVNLSYNFFNLKNTANAYNVTTGLLDMGAYIRYNFNFTAEPGWNNSYEINLQNMYDYQSTDGKIKLNTLEWTVINGGGLNDKKSGYIILKEFSPTFSNHIAKDIFLEFELNTTDETKTSFTTNIIGYIFDISEYDIFPTTITNISFISSDGLRLLVNNGLISLNNVTEWTINPIKEKIKSKLNTKDFNETLKFDFSWDFDTVTNCSTPFDVNNMDINPPAKGYLKEDDINLKIMDIKPRALFGLLNSGATANISEADKKINFGNNLIDMKNEFGYNYNISLILPEDIYLNNSNPYVWNDEIDFNGIFDSDNEPTYTEEIKSTVVEIEIQTTDLDLLSYFTGDTKMTFGIDIKETQKYNVTEKPEEFTLPNGIHLEKNYLTSDTIRLCIEEDIFSSNELDLFFNNQVNIFESRMKNIIPGLDIIGSTNREIFEDSLKWDKDITHIDDYTAVENKITAYCVYPISVDLSLLPPGFKIPAQKYNFTGLKNQTVTYKIIYPNGIDIEISDELGKSKVRELDDGRKYIEISFNKSEDNISVEVKCAINPSALFMLGIFFPCVLTLIITIILLIVIFVIRKKRKGGGKIRSEPANYEEEDISGYEGEDFYVPPPPGSKK